MEITKVTATVDYSDASAVDAAVEAFAEELMSAGSAVDLELMIIPGDADWGVSHRREGGAESEPLNCVEGERLESHSFQIRFPTYNHLLLEILHAPPLIAPFSTAACVYRSDDPGRPAFKISGYYAVSSLEIPTAVDIQLRPVTPLIDP